MGIILKSNLSPTLVRIPQLKITSFEFIAVDIRAQSRKLTILNIYRPPDKSIKTFLSEFSRLLQHLSPCDTLLIITWDFNIHVNDSSKKSTENFLTLIHDFALENCVSIPTYKSGNTLDLILDNSISPIVQNVDASEVFTFSDHYLVTFCIAIAAVPNKIQKLIKFRSYSENAKNEFLGFMETKIKSLLQYCNIATDLMEALNSLLTEGNDEFFPIQTKSITQKADADWYDKNCRLAKRECRKVERILTKLKKMKENGANISDDELNDLKSAAKEVFKEFKKLTDQSKREYYISKFTQYLKNPKATYGIIAHLLGKKEEKILPSAAMIDPLKFVNDFNQYLHDKISNIQMEIDLLCLNTFEKPRRQHTQEIKPLIEFKSIDNDDMDRYISRCKLTKCALDKVDFTKLELGFIRDIMIKIINAAFLSGEFPETEKESIVIPKLKNGALDHELPSSYRPVNNTTSPSKLAEIGMLEQLNEHLTANDILPEYQSGFRTYHSTETALVKVHSDILESIDTGKSVLMICLDLSSAFDTVDHQILLNELQDIGIQGTALSLFRTYLQNRTVRVSVNDVISDPLPLKYGVPQGSILAPVLFTIYTRTLPMLLDELGVSYHIYADDTQIYFEFDKEDIDALKDKIRAVFENLNKWMAAFKLKLNVSKTKLIMFNPKMCASKVRNSFGSIQIGTATLTLSETVKNLGVIIDQDLTFKDQISAVIKACNYAIYNLKPLKKYIPLQLFVTIVHQEVISRLDYCNALYLHLPKRQLKRLQIVINRCARMIFGLKRTARITTYLKTRLHWLPIAARIDFKVLLLVFKAIEFNQPQYLCDSLITTRRETRLKEHKSKGGHAFIRRSFHHSAPRLYNKIPRKIKSLKIAAFKKNLKTFFYQNNVFEKKMDSLLDYYPTQDPIFEN